MCCIRRPFLAPCSPVRPTLLRHMKHLFFLGLEVSPLPSSLLEEATGAALEAAGWFTTTYEERKQGGKKDLLVMLGLISHYLISLICKSSRLMSFVHKTCKDNRNCVLLSLTTLISMSLISKLPPLVFRRKQCTALRKKI